MATRAHSKEFLEVWEMFQETSRQFKEIEKRFKDTDKKFQNTEKLISSLTSKWGRFVEGLIAPAVVRIFGERNIAVDKVYQRVRARKNGSGMEVDILAIDGEYAVLIEAKSTLTVSDVKEHLDRLAKFKTYFPEYRDRKVVGAVAGIVIDENADRYAYQKGLFVITESGDTVAFLNNKKFVPKTW